MIDDYNVEDDDFDDGDDDTDDDVGVDADEGDRSRINLYAYDWNH